MDNASTALQAETKPSVSTGSPASSNMNTHLMPDMPSSSALFRLKSFSDGDHDDVAQDMDALPPTGPTLQLRSFSDVVRKAKHRSTGYHHKYRSLKRKFRTQSSQVMSDSKFRFANIRLT